MIVGGADLGGAGTLATAAMALAPAMGLGCEIVGDTGIRRLFFSPPSPTGAVFSSVGG
jgi:hypothetical protein